MLTNAFKIVYGMGLAGLAACTPRSERNLRLEKKIVNLLSEQNHKCEFVFFLLLFCCI